MKFILYLVTLSHCFILSSCSKPREQVIENNFRYIISGFPTDLSPFEISTGNKNKILSNIFESLLKRDSNNILVPHLAESFRISDDFLKYSFRLRKNVYFHNGDELTSEDVALLFNLSKDKSNPYPLLAGELSNVKSVRIEDRHNITFTFKEKRFSNLEKIATLSIVPRSYYQASSLKNRKMHPIGSGPYRFISSKVTDKYVLERNQKWWGKNLPQYKGYYNFDKITFHIVKDETLRMSLMESGKADFIDEVSVNTYQKRMKQTPWGKAAFRNKLEKKIKNRSSYVSWSLSHKIFKSAKVREAMSYFINRQQLITKFYSNLHETAQGGIFNGVDFNYSSKPDTEYNPSKGLEILTNQGWKDHDKDGVLDKIINGKKVNFEFDMLFYFKESKRLFSLIKEDIKKYGIKINLKFVDMNTFLKLLRTKNFDAYFLNVTSYPPGLLEYWESSNFYNFQDYNNPEFNRAISQLEKTFKKKERERLYIKANEIFEKDHVVTFLFSGKYFLYGTNRRIRHLNSILDFRLHPASWTIQE